MAKESICRNCFHSYVCEQFNENKDDSNEKCHFSNDHYVSTADVVPKSEVEMLQGALKAEERHNELTMEMAQKALANAKAEGAREIFEEIERKITHDIDVNNACIVELDGSAELYHRVKGELFVLCDIQDFIAELKKKYTERISND